MTLHKFYFFNATRWYNSHFKKKKKDFKGDLLCKIHFYKVFEHSCVAAVYENHQPIMLKIHQLIFLSNQ